MFNLAFYSPILPQASVWIIFGLILEYWMNKYTLLKKRQVTKSLSFTLSIEMIEMLEYYLPIFGISCMYFNFLLRDDFSILALVPFIIGIINALLPMQKINEYLFSNNENQENTHRFSDIASKFESDYLKANPGTR